MADFQRDSKTFEQIVTFTRASTATYYDAQGALQTAAVDEKRLTHDPATGESLGLLIEEQKTRLNTIAAAPTVAENVTVTAVAHTISFFGTGTIDLSGAFTGSLVGTGANDRATLTITPTAGTLTLTPSGTVENLQLEAGSFATSVILGEGSQVTRSADNASVDDLSGWFNGSEGTLLADGEYLGTGTPFGGVFAFTDGSGSNRIGVYFDASSAVGGDNDNITFLSRKNGGGTATINSGVSSIGTGRNKAAISFNEIAIKTSVNGHFSGESLHDGVPTINTLDGQGATFGSKSIIKSILYIPRALSAEELQILTAPEAN